MDGTRAPPIIDDLLKMISKGGNPTTNRPPPVPPKPKLESPSSNANERGFRRYFSPKSTTYYPIDGTEDTGSVTFTRKHDAQESMVQSDNKSDNHEHHAATANPTARLLLLNTPSRDRYSQRQTRVSVERFLRDDSSEETQLPDTMAGRAHDNGSNHHQSIKPIVTESPEEANNNNDIIKRNQKINTSTVEILEVPLKHNSQTQIHGNNKHQTFSRSQRQQQQLFYENNSHAAPVVTSNSDDEGGEAIGVGGARHKSDKYEALCNEFEVESILNESSNNHPPRTSTPNTVYGQYQNSASSTPTVTNVSSAASQITHSIATNRQQLQDQEDDCANQTDEDAFNISRDTDELTNTSALNQSGGCEIVGINDNSDSVNNSKERAIDDPDMTPFKVLARDHAAARSSTSILDDRPTNREHQSSPCCQDKIRELEKLTSSLVDYVEELKSQILNLTCKVDELESQVDKQQGSKQFSESNNRNRSTSHISTLKQASSLSPNSNVPNHRLTQSTFAINRVTPLNNQPGAGLSPSASNFSRSQVATISRNSNTTPNSRLMSPSMSNYNNSRLASSQSCSNTITKRLNVHASTNSLYADSLKSGNASISPTSSNFQHRQSTSPNSLMNLTSKRDPMASCTSMLSLCSLGQQAGSTLKKASAASGSVSNLSQAGSQLTNWPSLSDFVPGKHRAKDISYSEEERLIRMVLYNASIAIRLPNWAESNYNLDKVIEPPSVRLKLDWVYGYRGRDCRSNIFYLPTGECVYFVASIIVLLNPDRKTQRHYLGHTDSVKCLAVHPNKLIIASGQSAVQNKRDKRPIVRVWNTVSLATLRVIGFNEDFDRSICCLAFSKHDQGATLAVVDESNEHTITILDWQRDKNWRLAETNSGHEPVLAIDFHPIDKHSLVAVGKSSINFWDTRGMVLSKKAGLFDKYDKPKYVLCLTFNDLGDTITGDSNGSVIIWPRGGNRPKRVIHDAHNGGVFSVLAMKDGSYLTGGRDRRIIEWDDEFNRTGREAELPEHCGGVRFITYARGSQVLIGTLRNSILLGSLDTNFVLIMQGHTEATSSLAIHPNESQYLTGGFDDQIHLFDTKTHDVVWSKCLMMPVTAAAFSPNGLLLVVGSTLGKWLVLDVITQEILFTKCDGSGTISCIKFSPDGEYFCMGSSDSQVYVYQTTEAGNKFCKMGVCVGHTRPIKEIDWSDDSRYIQTQSMNFELLFWKALNCRPLDDEEIIDDLIWFTHNCTLGFSVIGIWSDSIDSALINYCDKSNNEDLMVTVTDTGNINIFKWPPCYNQCLSQKYYGNVEKFNFIKFLPDDSRLIAVGAKNCVTTEWIVDKGEHLEMSDRI